jgi:hypothetical protein
VAGLTFQAQGTVVHVGTIFGDLFRHSILLQGEPAVGPAVKYSGSKIGVRRPIDNWVVRGNNTFLVGLVDGSVFRHTEGSGGPSLFELTAPVQLSGPPVAARPPDKHVVSVAQDIVVITHDGGVFPHRLINPNRIEPLGKATGPPVASNARDRWVIAGQVGLPNARDEIFVITSAGEVFAHQYNANPGGVPSVGPATKLNGPPVALNAQDRWVLLSGAQIVVITDAGAVFVHAVS